MEEDKVYFVEGSVDRSRSRGFDEADDLRSTSGAH